LPTLAENTEATTSTERDDLLQKTGDSTSQSTSLSVNGPINKEEVSAPEVRGWYSTTRPSQPFGTALK